MKETRRGGARAGAGRKKSVRERISVQFRMNKDDLEIIRIHADFCNKRLGQYLEECLKHDEWQFYAHQLATNQRMKSEEEQKRIIEDIKKSIAKNAKV